MSVDVAEVVTPAPPPPAATPDLTQFVVDQLKPTVEAAAAKVANQAVAGATAQAKSVVAGVQSDVAQLQADFLAHRVEVKQQLAKAGAGALNEVATDSVLQRNIVYAVVGTALLMAVIILVAYLFGDSQASRIWGAAPGLVGGAVLWISSAGVKLPNRQVVKP